MNRLATGGGVVFLAALFCMPILAEAGSGGWIEFTDETSSRLIATPQRGINDQAENDFAYGDVDQDGDVDIVVARKTDVGSACNGSNLCQNQLLMFESLSDGHDVHGVFVDRTQEYVTAADDGGNGFNDITNDRDIILVDVNGDTWLDIVTAPTISDGLSKTISHPRVYINLGESNGEWLGFRYEEARIPQIRTIGANLAVAPRFCSVAAGDVDEDGDMDLYFGDYDNAVTAPQMPNGHDVNDRLFLNDGNGFFTDSLETRMTSQMLLSAFGMASAIVDMNGDGSLDVVKDTALQTPQRISISYNDPNNPGQFNDFDVVYDLAPYHVTPADLNQDGRLDLVVTDDGDDRYMINTGNGGDGLANFLILDFTGTPDDGFGGNHGIADLNNDGHVDVVITDVDVDFDGCSRRMHIYRNLGNLPNVTLQEQGGAAPWTPNGSHDIVIMDINGDGWQDMFIGTCSGYEIWINEPPVGMVFAYPEGLPAFVVPEESFDFTVSLQAIGGGQIDTNSAELFVSIDGGAFTSSPLTFISGNEYQGTFPGAGCTQLIDFYVTADLLNGGGTFSDPVGAPAATYSAVAAAGTGVTLRDEIEEDVSGWTVINTGGLTGGAWEQADPNGTIIGIELASPEDDATSGLENTMAFVTQNGLPGGSASSTDVDGGPTYLISPTIDLDGTDGSISFARWVYSSGDDQMTVHVSNDGGDSWTFVQSISDTGGEWLTDAFQVGAYVEPTSEVAVRFGMADPPADPSITEGGVDNFQVEELLCFLNQPFAQSAGPRHLLIDVSSGGGAFAIYVTGDQDDVNTACVAGYLQADGTLGASPVFQDAATWGINVYATGEEIIPGGFYVVQYDSGTPGNPELGPEAFVSTPVHGDVDENGAVNFADIQLVVQAFQQNFANVALEAADLEPCVPNGVVNFADILENVLAFQGQTYAESGCPLPCD
ncbi:MAG: FG-GAP-like repeat-containing protein [Phycisphaerae bacterium]